jgi:hypothetical protein
LPAWPSAVCSVLAAATLGAYLAIVGGEHEGADGRVAFVAFSLAVSAALALTAALLRSAAARLPLLGAATATLLAWGFLGIFSIGLPLLVAAGFGGLAIARAAERSSRTAAWLAAAAALAAAAVVAGGLMATA